MLILSFVSWRFNYFSFLNWKTYLGFNVDVNHIVIYEVLYSPFWLIHVGFIYLLFWLIFKSFV